MLKLKRNGFENLTVCWISPTFRDHQNTKTVKCKDNFQYSRGWREKEKRRVILKDICLTGTQESEDGECIA